MAIKAVLGFLIALFSIGILAGIALAVINSQRGRRTQPGTLIAIIGAVGVLFIAPLNAGLVLVEPNEVGVVFRQTAQGDAALREPLQSGLHWVIPFVDQVIVYDVSQQSITMAGSTGSEYNQTQVGVGGTYSAVRATSSDGQVIYVDATVIFRLDSTQINDIHRNWRDTYIEGFIIPQMRSEVRNLVSTYGAEEIYSGGRAELETRVSDALRVPLQQEGFILFDVLIRNIEFSSQFTDAIEQKQIAEQEAQRAAFRVQQAEQEADKARVDAQGRADSVVIEAQGDAEATVIRAEAEAEALDLINQILVQNPDLIQWQYVNQLGENVRVIIVPSNSPYLFDLESMIDAAGGEPVSTPVPTPMPESDEPVQ
jgi:regulator of protease activity HflC (stomatin/prohibitin superfamily)